jgi:GcrA cell cycle regulator
MTVPPPSNRREEVRRLTELGWTSARIAKELGVRPSSVFKMRRRLGINPERKFVTEEQTARVVELRAQRLSADKISKEIGIGEDAVLGIIRRLKLDPPRVKPDWAAIDALIIQLWPDPTIRNAEIAERANIVLSRLEKRARYLKLPRRNANRTNEWTTEQIQRLREMWDGTLTVDQIAERLGVSPGAVSGMSRRINAPTLTQLRKQKGLVPIRSERKQSVKIGKREDSPNNARFMAAYLRGMSDRAIAAETRRAVDHVRRWRNYNKLPPHADVPRAAPKPKLVVTNRTRTLPITIVAKQKPRERPAMEIDMQSLPNPRQCRWPMWGDVGWPTHRYCCAPRVSGRPYCDEHVQIACVRIMLSGRRGRLNAAA